MNPHNTLGQVWYVEIYVVFNNNDNVKHIKQINQESSPLLKCLLNMQLTISFGSHHVIRFGYDWSCDDELMRMYTCINKILKKVQLSSDVISEINNRKLNSRYQFI